jgi:hypothetical protein
MNAVKIFIGWLFAAARLYSRIFAAPVPADAATGMALAQAEQQWKQ